jgi:DNA-binding transcriptional MerR regulator
MWERRYQVVTPVRAAGGGREYTSDDVERLQLIKQLVDAGDAISSIARLDNESLIARSMQTFSAVAATEKLPPGPCRIVVVGATLAGRLSAEAEAMSGVELLAASPTIEACLSGRPSEPADVLVIEIPTVHADTTRQILGWLEDIGAQKALVVYRFASTEALQQLPAARVQTVQAPVTPLVVRNLCLGMRPLPAVTGAGQAGVSLSVTPRRYSNEALAKLALASTTVKCECPKHLAELISDLVAFERYSSECENRNLKDAALHGYLHATASQARNLIEDALAHVIEVENISLDQ